MARWSQASIVSCGNMASQSANVPSLLAASNITTPAFNIFSTMMSF